MPLGGYFMPLSVVGTSYFFPGDEGDISCLSPGQRQGQVSLICVPLLGYVIHITSYISFSPLSNPPNNVMCQTFGLTVIYINFLLLEVLAIYENLYVSRNSLTK